MEEAKATEGDIIINEIYATGNDDWIELYNPTGIDFNLAINNFRLYKAVAASPSLLMRFGNMSDGSYPGGNVIKAKSYYLIVRDDASESLRKKADAICTKESFTWSSEGYTLYLGDDAIGGDDDPDIVDRVIFGNGKGFAPKILDGSSIGRLNSKNTNDNSQDFTLQESTPGAENSKLAEKIPESPKVYSDKIQITELFPNPFQAQYEEYIELYNGTAEKVDLAGWTLHDASKTGKYTFPVGFLIKAKEYLAIFKKDFKFALNNSGDERVTLFDPSGKEVSKALYDGSKQNLSYNFDGNRWRWSKFLTPGAENILNSEPYGTLKKAENIYVNVYADFSISTGDSDGDSVKVVWDFGDGHKSYLLKTRHKYLATGKYLASVKLTDGSEEVLKEFEVEVQKIPHPKVSLISVNANPKGKDSEFETLTVKNNSKKKINLKGWSIATGTKKLANHPISEKLMLKKKETKEITRQFSSFSLNNKKAKIELRYPDGKVASKIKYDHGKVSIAEDEVYEKGEEGWNWIEKISNDKSQIPNKSQDTITSSSSVISNQSLEIQNRNEGMGEEVSRSIEIKRENKILNIKNDLVKIALLKGQPMVLGAETVREVDGQYFFTPKIEQKHYLVSFWEKLLVNFNAGMNQVLNYFWR